MGSEGFEPPIDWYLRFASVLQRFVNAGGDQPPARYTSLEFVTGRVASGASRHAGLGHDPCMRSVARPD